jgi:hypothetical protein
MAKKLRFAAGISRPLDVKKTRHYIGLPPQSTDGKDLRRELEPASVLVIEQEEDGIFLLRLTSDGRTVGDTWHRSIDEAKEQATYEFDGLVSEWKRVPSEVGDIVRFALE